MTDSKATTVPSLKRLFAAIVAEAEANPDFAERLSASFRTPQRRRSTASRRRRAPGAFDPFAVAQAEGADGLAIALRALDVDQLKDIVAENGMDPAKLALKWRTPERLVNHILTFVAARERKGDAFRAEGARERTSRNLWGTVQSVVRPSNRERVQVRHAPAITVELGPSVSADPLTDPAMVAVVKHLQPLNPASYDGTYAARIRDGRVVFSSESPASGVATATAVTNDSWLHGVDLCTLSALDATDGARGVVPVDAVETIIGEAVANYLHVAQAQMRLKLPIEGTVSLNGVDGFALAVAHRDRPIGEILTGQVSSALRVDSFSTQVVTLLRPFFESIYEAAGVQKRAEP